jgi:predicted transcriptional regulator
MNVMIEENSLENLKYLLGSMGIEILLAISRGAKDFESIKLISGVPIACIKGRVPVLIDFELVVKSNEDYLLTEKGTKLKAIIENNN